jgi:glycosyltransferase involved in cell wall biosynthesis
MKILHINSAPVYGGAEIYLKGLCALLSEKGHDSIFCYTTYAPDGYKRERNEYFIGESQGVRTGLGAIKRLRRIINYENPDIIHLHSADYNTSPLVIRAMKRMRPTVYTVHNILGFCPKDPGAERLEDRSRILSSTKGICDRPVDLSCLKSKCINNRGPDRIYTLLLRLWKIHEYKRLDRIVVHSRFVKETLLRQGFPKEKISLVKMFIPVERQWQREPVSSERDKAILFIGSLSRAKGIFEFVRALNMIRDIKYKAIIVGDGYCYREVRRDIERMNLSEKVILKGWVSHEMLHIYYNMASVVVMPTMCPEALGFVGIEAMYFGKPVIAFDSGGINEWLRHGSNGYIVPFNDVKGFADVIRHTLEDDRMRLKLSENAIVMSQEFLHRDRHIERILEIYREAKR